MKATILKTAAAIVITTAIFTACKKETAPTPTTTTTTNSGTYSSLGAFLKQYQPPVLSYSITGSTGGVFETPQGTYVSVPAGCFRDSHGNQVNGTVNVQFLDIYKKSDMLFSGVLPVTTSNLPMNSGGEFFIKATYGGVPVTLVGTNPISVRQPLNGFTQDNGMKSFTILKSDSIATPNNWTPDTSYSSAYLYDTTSEYVFNLYQLNVPADSGTWCNSDNPNYFSAYTQVPFTVQTTDSIGNSYNTAVFLLFNGINSMVHVYYSGSGTYYYKFAPQGLTCTVVAIEVDNKGKLRAAFVPSTTITNGGKVNFTATVTIESAFTTTLATYNH